MLVNSVDLLMQAAQRALVVVKEKSANDAKSEFMSLMCHEVRTPLNGCLASAEMLLETPLLDEQRELTNTIRISGSILLSTVSNFLDFFKVQAGKALDIVRIPFHIMDLVSDVHCIVEAMMGPQRKVRPVSVPYSPERVEISGSGQCACLGIAMHLVHIALGALHSGPFDVGSQHKTFTSVCLLKLLRRCQWLMDIGS
jgi:signal transduction histidine kinase